MDTRIRFLGSLAAVKANGFVNGLVKLAVQFDPEGATDAQILTMEGKLDEFGTKVSELETQLTKETGEYEAAKKEFDETVTAAGIIQMELADPNCPDRTEKEGALNELITLAETQKPEVAAEKADVDDVQGLITELRNAHLELGKKIRQARDNMGRAQRNIERNTIAANRAEQRAEATVETAGIRKSTQTLDIALNAMNQIATQEQERRRAAELKIESLKAAEPTSNSHVAAALAQAKGKTPTSTLSASDRLAALKGETRTAA
jgi:hypothetical protein